MRHTPGHRTLHRLVRSGYGLAAGVLAMGAAAAAAGAAPSALTPWASEHHNTTTIATTPSEPVHAATPASSPSIDPTGHPITILSDAPHRTESASAPATTEPAAAPAVTVHAPDQAPLAETVAGALASPPPNALPPPDGVSDRVAPGQQSTEPTAPATTAPHPAEPAATTPATPPPTSAAPAAEPTHTGPAATEPPPAVTPVTPLGAEPAVTVPPTTAPQPDNSVPGGLSLTCSLAAATVTCDWSGPVPDRFSAFVLLRGNGGSSGRVPFRSSDSSASHVVDAAVPAGSYTYLIVALDAAQKPLVHSNMVPITVSGG